MTVVRRCWPGLLAMVLSVAACSSGTGSSVPSGPAITRTAPAVSPGATVASSSAGGSLAPLAGQTDTDWGRIWDTLPGGFPTISGATAGEETATGPATADLIVDGVDAKGITTRFETLLEGAGFTTAGLSGPLENGGYVLTMNGSAPGCEVQVSVAPTGSLTTLTILYGASCPHD